MFWLKLFQLAWYSLFLVRNWVFPIETVLKHEQIDKVEQKTNYWGAQHDNWIYLNIVQVNFALYWLIDQNHY